MPMVFSPVNKKLFCSNVPIVQSALYSLEKHVEQSMIVSWNKQIALQLQVLLKWFQPFLVSPLTKNCHIVFMQLSEIESPTKIALLANFFGLVSVDVLDEFAAAKLCMNGNLSLRECFEKSLLQQWKSLGSLCEFVLLVCPHNMNTKSWFSRMKFAESQHQNCLLPET